MTIEETAYFRSANGLNEVFYRRWRPMGAPRAQPQILHGLSEHSGRYAPLARHLNALGILVCAHDHIGHGRSFREGQPKGFFAEQDGWQCVLRDARRLHELAEADAPGLPYFMLGHSMGSFVLRHYLIQYPGALAGAVLSGTGQVAPGLLAFGRRLAAWEARRLGNRHLSKWLQLAVMGSYNRRIKPRRTLVDWLSRDEAAVDAYQADPLCRILPTIGMYADMFEGLRLIGDPAQIAKMDKALPVYPFSGDADPVGGYGKQVRWLYEQFRQAGLTDLTLKLYAGGRHEMLNEINKAQVYDDLTAWLLARLPHEENAPV